MEKICLYCGNGAELKQFNNYGRGNMCRACQNKRNASKLGIADFKGQENEKQAAIEILVSMGYEYNHPTLTIHEQFLARHPELILKQKKTP